MPQKYSVLGMSLLYGYTAKMQEAPTTVTIWIDFSSPYGYIAAMRQEAWAKTHGYTVKLQPFLLGLLFRDFGKHPILDMPQKAAYLYMDVPRVAAHYGIPIQFPKPYPFGSIHACRVYYALAPEHQKAYAMAVYHRTFAEGQSVDGVEVALDVLRTALPACDSAQIANEVVGQSSKRALFAVGKQATELGVCGSPYFVVTTPDATEHHFWGQDRMDSIPDFLSRF